jgi:ankyrin repeat protein
MTQALSGIVWDMDLARLKVALADGPDLNLTHGEGVLHGAVEKDWAAGITALIGAGADANLKSEREDTPLIVAVVHKKPGAAQALIDGGADLEIPNKLGSTPYNYLVRMNAGSQVTMTSWVIEDGVKKETVSDPNVPRSAAMEVAVALAKAGAAVDAEDNGGITALGHAASAGDLGWMQLALEHGANPAHTNRDGYQPILAAAANGRVEAVQLLIERGAEASASDKAGFTPLHEAAMAGNVELAKVLLAAGASVDAAVKEGWNDIKEGMTPRDIAVLKAHAEVIALLPG